MLPTYSLQACTTMPPHPVCCQPTAYKLAHPCLLTLYVANLQPYKLAQPCLLPLYVANLQPTSLHTHASSPCMLPTYSPTSSPNHASSPCMLPTYSLQACTPMPPHPVCCQPTALQACTIMPPHPVCCQPTAYKLAQSCLLTLYVANLQPTSLHTHASSPCMLPTYSPTSSPNHASSPCMLPTYSLQACAIMLPSCELGRSRQTETDRDRDRQRQTETDRQTDRQTDRHDISYFNMSLFKLFYLLHYIHRHLIYRIDLYTKCKLWCCNSLTQYKYIISFLIKKYFNFISEDTPTICNLSLSHHFGTKLFCLRHFEAAQMDAQQCLQLDDGHIKAAVRFAKASKVIGLSGDGKTGRWGVVENLR